MCSNLKRSSKSCNTRANNYNIGLGSPARKQLHVLTLAKILRKEVEALKSTSAELAFELADTRAKIKGLKFKKAELEENAWDLLKEATGQFHNMIAIQQDPEVGEAEKAILVKTVELLKTVITARGCLTDAFLCKTFATSSGQRSQSSQWLLLSLSLALAFFSGDYAYNINSFPKFLSLYKSTLNLSLYNLNLSNISME